MSNMHRIQWFDQQIIQGSYPNSTKLAQQFEISKRQAQRDIEYLEMSLRAPLLYVARHRGYCYEDKAYVLPHLYMTEDEKKVLKYLAHRYRNYNYDNADAIRRVAQLLERFTGEQGSGSSFRLPVFEANPRMMHNLELLSHAVRQKLVVQMTYTDQGAARQAQLYPLKLISEVNADYIAAYCARQRLKITVRLDQIQQLILTESHYEYSEDMETNGPGNPPPVLKPYTARIQMLRPVHGDTWKGYPILSRDGLLYRISFYDADAFLQHLLVAEWKELESPQWLKKKLAHLCQQTLQRLGVVERE